MQAVACTATTAPLRISFAMAASGPGHAGAVPEPVQALTSPEVRVELLDGAVLLVTLQRPRKLNAVTPSMLATLAKAMAWPGTTAGAGATAVVLTGSAGNFTSGADVSGSSPSSEVGLDRAPVADFMHAMVRGIWLRSHAARHTSGDPFASTDRLRSAHHRCH